MAGSLVKEVDRTVTLVLAIAGLIAIPPQVAAFLDSAVAGWVMGIGLALLLAVPAARFLMPTRVQRRFGIRRYHAPPILVSSVEKMAIAADYSAKIETTQTLVFTESPAPDDLIDIIDVLPSDSIDESSYFSPDSDVTDVVRKSPSTLAIRWRPRSPIVLFVPHVHQTIYQTPPVYGDDAFYQALYVDRDTGIKDWEITSERPIERAFAFAMPRVGARVTEEYLYRRFVMGDSRGCEQPILDPGGQRLTWRMQTPEKGRTYVLFAVYEGHLPYVLQQAALASSWPAKLRALLSPN